MDSVAIAEDQVAEVEYIAPGVRGLRILFVNVFCVEDPDGSWTLIDTGLPLSGPLIRKWAEKHFSAPPKGIVLTHGHFDHVSSADTLAAEWNVPIYAHPLEFPYLTGQKDYPAPNVGAGGGMMSLLSPMYPRSPVNLGTRLRALPETDGAMPLLAGWELLHTPGHTPGHVSFFRPGDRTLLVGDAFCTTKPESFFKAAVAQTPELHGPPSYFTSDWEQARQSVRKLSRIEALTVAPGHGKPLSGIDVPGALQTLAVEFDRVAVPENEKRSA